MTAGSMTPGSMIPGGVAPGGVAPSATPIGALANGVILAENDGLMRSVIRSVLVRAEQQVFPVADGLEAVALARQFRARLVMLDVAMPRLDGLQTCEAIRALPGYADVPIVMLTGYDDAPTRQAALRLGANEFITKPFRPYLLLARLSTYLDLPAHMVPAEAAGADDVLPGARVWNTRPEAKPAPRESPQLDEGRATVVMYRKADRRG
jgi:CheY-like chemotaxis protein